jgi:endonuclease YncB( thermonuclease family)
MINPKQKYTYEINVFDDQIYDGDTINNVLLDLGLDTFRIVDLRLARINTPEIRGGDAATKQTGFVARDALRAILKGREDITIHILKYEKYGRCLVELFVGEQNVNDFLLAQGFAKPYPL